MDIERWLIKNKPYVYTVIRSKLRYKNSEVVSEIYTDVAIKLIKAKDVDPARIKNLTYRIILNAINERYGKKQTLRESYEITKETEAIAYFIGPIFSREHLCAVETLIAIEQILGTKKYELAKRAIATALENTDNPLCNSSKNKWLKRLANELRI